MKIAVIAHLKFPIREPYAGGLEMQTHALVKGLQAKGHDVDLFAAPNSDPDLKPVAIDIDDYDLREDEWTQELPDGFDDIFIKEHHAYMDLMLQLQASNYDIVHNNSQHYLPLNMAHLLPNNVVTTLHVPPFPFLRSAAKSAARYDQINYVSISRHTHRTWENIVPDTHTIYNGINLKDWKFGKKPMPKTAFWCGRICKEKAPHLALKAAKKAGFFLTIAGPKSDEQYFNEKVKPLLNPHLNRYVGHLNQRNLNREIRKSAVYLFTSIWEEPYGLVLAEALASGTPVASFNSGAAPEILTEKTGFIVPKGNVKALAKYMQYAAKLNRKDCRKRAENFCSLERMIEEYENHYRQIVQQNQQKAPVQMDRLPQLLTSSLKKAA